MKFNLINADAELCDTLYNGSAWTWEGMSTDEENLEAIADWFAEQGCPLTSNDFYITTGATMNAYCGGLKGRNAYQKDLTILSIPLDNITDVNKLVLKKFQVGARWFDDIVDNNRHRG